MHSNQNKVLKVMMNSDISWYAITIMTVNKHIIIFTTMMFSIKSNNKPEEAQIHQRSQF